ncbi:MAG: hypothetical protein ACW98W_20265 [Candidatus Hodarchaeales archaeon]|jgi:hypothetical protein
MSEIEEIVRNHKSGEGDFNPQLPFDPTDIMQIEIKNNLGDEEE